MWQFWLIAAGIFFVIEIMTVGFLLFWFGIGALIALVVSLFTGNLYIQSVVFLVSSSILIIFTKPLVKKFIKINDTIPTNVKSIVGKTGIVVENITDGNNLGKVKVNGELWSAVSDTDIPKGTKIEVLKVNGVKLTVKPVKPLKELTKNL